jgi:3-keto-disaccharide hydrolase
MQLSGYVRGAAAIAASTVLLSVGPIAQGQQQTQQPQAQGRAGQPPQGRGQGGGMRGAAPYKHDDYAGFTSIFDGTMKNWDGDPAIWKAEGNALVGTTTAEKPLTQNTFVIWRGGEPADFELKVEYRMSATNSGIQFRSTQVPAGGQGDSAIGKWVLKGYQADIDFANQFTGMICGDADS